MLLLLFACVAFAEYVNVTGNETVSGGYLRDDESPFSRQWDRLTRFLDRLTSGPQEWNLGTMRNAFVVLCPDAETWEACNENYTIVNLFELVKQVRDLQQAVEELKK